MIDYVEEVVPGKYARGFKNLTLNEWYFPIHFPGGPNMPGALQLEAMAQMLTVAITTLPGLKGRVTHAIQHFARYRREVLPSERLDIYAEVLSWKRGLCKGRCVASVAGEVASETESIITIPEILDEYLPIRKK